MADHDISKPLLPHSPHLILTIQQNAEPQTNQRSSPRNQHRNHNHVGKGKDSNADSRNNPFSFLGSDWFKVPGMNTVDPFLNHTVKIEGIYEWVKIVICLPIALVRLVIFGVCLSVGYIATKLALQGWKDRQNPMPKWRCRIMWITRISARCILFSFGYV